MKFSNAQILGILLLILIGACKSNVPLSSIDESFDEFYDRFHEDMDYQMDRVKFPLEGEYVSIDGGEPWTKEGWEPHLQKVTEISDPNYDTEIVRKGTEVVDKVQLRDSGFSIERRFELIDGKWYLVYYQTVDL